MPSRKDIGREYAQGFEGMTAEPLGLDEMLAACETLVVTVAGGMPEEHKAFLLGFKRGTPDWGLLGVQGASELPAVRWKQLNLKKMSVEAREHMTLQLRKVLGVED